MIHKKIALLSCFFCSFLVLAGFPMFAYGVNYSDGAHCPPGFYFVDYQLWYSADKTTDDEGHTDIKGYGLDKYSQLLRPAYYGKNYVVHMIVPVGQLTIDHYREKDTSVGDIVAGGGYFLPIPDINVLPALNIKFPTGNFDSDDTVNFGSGQYDIKPELYINKTFGKFTIDAAFKYSYRLKNYKTDREPGDEYYIEGLLTYALNDRWRLGPTFVFGRGGNAQLDHKDVAHSDILQVSAGLEFIYTISCRSHFLLDVVPDVYTENTTRGMLVAGRFCYAF